MDVNNPTEAIGREVEFVVGDYKLPFVLCWIKLSLNWTVNIVVHFPRSLGLRD